MISVVFARVGDCPGAKTIGYFEQQLTGAFLGHVQQFVLLHWDRITYTQSTESTNIQLCLRNVKQRRVVC